MKKQGNQIDLTLLTHGIGMSFLLPESEIESENINLSIVVHRAILFVIFYERHSLGLIKLRIKHVKTEFKNNSPQ